MAGASGAARGPTERSGHPRSLSRATVLFSSGVSLVAALMAGVSAVAPWWYLSVAGPVASSKVEFFPGTGVYTSTNGGGGVTTYAAVHVPSVGSLYAGVLLGTVTVAVLAGAAALAEFASVRGTWRPERARGIARAVLLAAVVLGVTLAVLVPFAQPALYRYDDPMGACTSASVVPACRSFWGSNAQGGVTTTWGAAAGWWLELAAVVLLSGTLILEVVRGPAGAPPRRSRGEPLGAPERPSSSRPP